MKQKLKKLSIVSLLLSAFVIFSCSEDYEIHDHNDNNQKFKLRTLNNQKINSNIKVVEKLQSLNKGTKKNNNSIVSRIIYNQENNFSINTDYVKYIENTETGNHSFNFQITRLDTISNKIENLVLISNSQGNYDAYIFKYNLTAQEFKSVNLNVSNSLTDIIPIDFDLNTLSTDLNSKTVYGCTETWTWVSGEHDGNELHGALWKGKCLVSGCSYNGAWVLTDISCGYHDDGTGGDATNNPTGNSTDGGGSTTNGSNSNYDGSNTSIHGNGNIIALPAFADEEIADDPCISLQKLLDPTQCNISPKLNSLGNMLDNAADNGAEQGFSFQINEDGNYVNPQIPNSGDGSIHLPTGMVGNNIVYGAAHSHIAGLIDMYSWSDVYFLITLYIDAPNQVKSDIVFMLVTPSGKCYALKIDNIRALHTFMIGQYNQLKSEYPNWTEKEILTQLNEDSSFSGDQDDLERKFLDFYKNAGISLYETLWDNDYEGYKKFRKISLPANPSAALDKTDC